MVARTRGGCLRADAGAQRGGAARIPSGERCRHDTTHSRGRRQQGGDGGRSRPVASEMGRGPDRTHTGQPGDAASVGGRAEGTPAGGGASGLGGRSAAESASGRIRAGTRGRTGENGGRTAKEAHSAPAKW